MPTQRTAPTLSDVAHAAGVSTATVSRCLNTPERVVDATRQKVMSAVNQLGYAPNFAARVMAVRQTKTIGAVVPTMENAVFARGLQAFQEELRTAGYTLLLASSSYNPEIEEEQVRTLVARGADGILLIGHDRADELRVFLEAQNVPALVAWAVERDGGLPAIGFDNYGAMKCLADQVVALGHSRIGVISAFVVANDRARLRLQGIRDACAEAGIGAEGLHIVETPYGIETGASALGELMMRDLPPTVVMCGNDVLAVGAIRGARAMGFDIPGDLSVTGFDDIELAGIVSPGLTTVRVPQRAMGVAAARKLIGMVEHIEPSAVVYLATDIRMRGSLAPPRE